MPPPRARLARRDSDGDVFLGGTFSGRWGGVAIPTQAIVSPYLTRISNTGVVDELFAFSTTAAMEPLAFAVRADGTNVIAGTVASFGTLGGRPYGGPGSGDPIVFSTRPF